MSNYQKLTSAHQRRADARPVTLVDRWVAPLRALDEDYRLSALWRIMTPVWQAGADLPTVIWWNNLERIHMAVEDLGCRDLLE